MFGSKRREREQTIREYHELIDRAEAGDADAQDELDRKWSHPDPDEQKRIDAVKAARSARLLKDLIDRAEAGNEQAQYELVDSQWAAISEIKDYRVKRRCKHIRRIVEVRRDHFRHADVIEAFQAWQEVRDTDKEIWYLPALLREYDQVKMEENLTLLSQELGIRRQVARRILRQLVRARYDLLLEQAPDSLEAFRELWDLIRLTRLDYDTLYSFIDRNGVQRNYWKSQVPIRALEYPANWNDMGGEALQNPCADGVPRPARARSWRRPTASGRGTAHPRLYASADRSGPLQLRPRVQSRARRHVHLQAGPTGRALLRRDGRGAG